MIGQEKPREMSGAVVAAFLACLALALPASAEPPTQHLMRVFYPPSALKSFQGQDQAAIAMMWLVAIGVVALFGAQFRAGRI